MVFKAQTVFRLSAVAWTGFQLCRFAGFGAARFHLQSRLHQRFIVAGIMHYKNGVLKLMRETGVFSDFIRRLSGFPMWTIQAVGRKGR